MESSVGISDMTRKTYSYIFLAGILVLGVSGCGNSAIEVEKARRAEADALKRLEECEAKLAEVQKALETAKKTSVGGSDSGKGAANVNWNAARLTASAFLLAVNSRNAEAANAEGAKEFKEKNGGEKAIKEFSNGHFRGEASGYTCGPLASFEAASGANEFVGRGKLQYRGVPRHDSTYSVHVVKEGDKWRVASFRASAR